MGTCFFITIFYGRQALQIPQIDKELLWIINQDWTHPVLDRFMAVISSVSFWIPFLVVAVLLVLIFGGFRGRAFIFCLAVVLFVSDGIVVQFFKKTVDRPRPNQVVDGLRLVDLERTQPRFLALFEPLYIRETRIIPGEEMEGRSFPSGHTMNNLAVAMVFLVFFRRWGWLYLIPALLVSYSRIYTSAHWPTDVLVSILLGSGLALVVLACLETLWQTMGRRWFPGLHDRHPSLVHPV